MDLKGKKLIVLTGCNGASDIIQYAKSKGVYTIATDYNKTSKVKDMADCRYDISTTDIDSICELVKKHNVDGITTGTSETSMYTILEISKRLSVPFYASSEQLEIINNKKKFKDLLIKYDVPVTKEYYEKSEIRYPAIVKPVDSSGSKGISICRNEGELSKACKFALKFSRSGQIIIEECVSEFPEVFFNYTIIDGEFSLSCSFDNYKNRDKNGFAGDAVINLYPSRRLQSYIEKAHNNVVNALKSIGLQNGVISIQTFFNGETFLVYEAGYRLGGTQSYIFTNEVNGINHMEMMVNYALTGKMSEKDILKQDNPFFNRPCCQRNISLKSGMISKIEGIEAIKKIGGVLNVTQVHKEGDVIKNEGARKQLCLRIHIVGDSIEKLSEINDKINSTIDIRDENGNDMVNERHSFVIEGETFKLISKDSIIY